jgi:hypothetical protein
VICLLIVGLMISVSVASAESDSEKQSLKGIKALEVLIEGLGEEEKQAGLTESSLRVLVEGRLRKAGIKVVDDSINEPGRPYLYLNINCLTDKSGSEIVRYIYSYDLQLKQGALLKRNSEFEVVPTWDAGGVGYFGTQKLGAIERSVEKLVDMFINDFLAMNPVKPH